MQGQGFIRVIAIALAIGCIYSLSFNWVAYQTEKKAAEYSKGDRKRYAEYIDSIATVPVYPGLNFTYNEVKAKCLNLGLDLKGGMDVTMEIQLSELIKSLSGNNPDAAFNKALEVASEREKNSQSDYITLFLAAYRELAPSSKLSVLFSTQNTTGKIGPTSSDKEVEAYLRQEGNEAITSSFNILRNRIDQFGVVQPNIQLITGTDRIQIELPGEPNVERVRKLLQGSAHLEFWRTFDSRDALPVVFKINKALADLHKLKAASSDSSKQKQVALKPTKKDSTALTSAKGQPSLLSKLKSNNAHKAADSNSKVDLIKQNPLLALLSPALYQDKSGQQQAAPGPVVGYAAKKDTAKVNEILRSPLAVGIIPQNMKLLWGVKGSDKTRLIELYAIKVTSRNGQPVLDGDAIQEASNDFDPNTGNPDVRMVMNSEGANIWRQVTMEASQGRDGNKEDKESVAIVLDNQVYTAPRVDNEIPNGVSSISGNFTIEETKDLANVLKAGRLPAPARIIGEDIVGGTLGKEAIQSGLLSALIGLIIVVLFMWTYYSRAGLVADLAVLANVFFIIGVLASVQAVLTLPGIAGIVLTIASSVDANVLIYERIREELHSGKSLRIAISDGFKHAYSSIIDSNAATLVLGVILFFVGSGPIKGFATTLIIGIFTSLFCAIFITRLVFEARLRKGKSIDFDRSFTRDAFKNIHFDFLKRRGLYYAFSAIVIAIGLISMFTKGFNLGVDFKGGRTYDIQLSKSVPTSEISRALMGPLQTAPQIQTISTSNRIKVTTDYLVADNSDHAQNTVLEKLKSGLGSVDAHFIILQQSKVGPTIANDIKTKAAYAVLLGIALVFMYILVRFRRWQFGVAAVVALAHDVLVLLSLFSIFNGILPFSLEVDQAFIAAILTVMGYSMLDTIVVFDRVREYLGNAKGKSESMASNINNALNSTLSRTVITSLTTVTVLLILFLFGGDSLKGFSFAMLIGVIFGTYSSLFVATPIVVDMISKGFKKQSGEVSVSTNKVRS